MFDFEQCVKIIRQGVNFATSAMPDKPIERAWKKRC